jgi:hypothetical protein
MPMHDASRIHGRGLERVYAVPGFDIRYFLAPIIAFALTVWIDPSYTGGDPSLYRYVYDGLSTGTLGHDFFFYSVILSSTEPLYYILVWTLSHIGVPRVLFIGSSSALLSFLVTNILVRRGANILFATAIACSSFYFLLLYTTTDRLKIAVILLIISVLTANRPKIAIIFAFLATAAHIQVAILYLSFLTIYMSNQLRAAIKTGTLSSNVIGTSCVVFIVVTFSYYVIGSQIASKADSYIGLGQTDDLLRVLPFYFISLFYTKDKVNVTLLFLPLIALTPIVGYGRLNIFSYFIFLYYCFEARRGFNVAMVFTALYFAYSSYAFVTRILEFGEPLLVGQ